MADIHHQHQAAQTLAAAQIRFQMFLPVLFERDRYLGITVAGQVDQATLVVQAEEVEQLRASRCFRGARQAGVGKGVERARLASVGAAGECHLQAAVLGALVDLGGTDEEAGLLAQTDDGIFREHGGIRWMPRFLFSGSRACDISAHLLRSRGGGRGRRFRFSVASI